MTFQQVLDGAEVLVQSGDPGVSSVEYDSRRVKPGCVFVAMRGESSDGNRFIDQAIQAGAVAVVTDSADEKPRPGVAWAIVPHGRRALARVSANFYKKPAERIAVTGITGTNGKSTTAFLVEAILLAEVRKSALIGTIEYHVAGKILPAPHTTPEALDLNRILNEALGNGATEVVMEVSSHALAQERVYGVPFDVAVFTNLTRDHLDYHKTMEEYFAAKRALFEGCGTDAAGACYARGCSTQAIAAGIDKLACVPGRFERVDCGQPFTVVVDYAHTDDALRNLTALARELVCGAAVKGRVLTVFGCGGDRDRKKRPLMGEAAGRGSDSVVLTSDNPRSEDPLAIINDAVVGLQKTGVKYSVEPDRRKAIGLAIGEAGPGDIVLLAGKGHEKVQVTREGSVPFDDLEVARTVLSAAGFDCAAENQL